VRNEPGRGQSRREDLRHEVEGKQGRVGLDNNALNMIFVVSGDEMKSIHFL